MATFPNPTHEAQLFQSCGTIVDFFKSHCSFFTCYANGCRDEPSLHSEYQTTLYTSIITNLYTIDLRLTLAALATSTLLLFVLALHRHRQFWCRVNFTGEIFLSSSVWLFFAFASSFSFWRSRTFLFLSSIRSFSLFLSSFIACNSDPASSIGCFFSSVMSCSESSGAAAPQPLLEFFFRARPFEFHRVSIAQKQTKTIKNFWGQQILLSVGATTRRRCRSLKKWLLGCVF